MKNKIALFAAFAATVSVCQNAYSAAFSFTIGSRSQVIKLSSGATAGAGEVYMRIGYFNGDSASIETAILGDTMTPEALNAAFVGISEAAGRGTVISGSSVASGFISTTATGGINGGWENLSNSFLPVNKQLYVVLQNAAPTGTPTQWAILKDSAWIVPADPAVPAAYPISITDSNLAANEFLAGAKGSIQLENIVPEPTSATLAATGLLGLFRRRRA